MNLYELIVVSMEDKYFDNKNIYSLKIIMIKLIIMN